MNELVLNAQKAAVNNLYYIFMRTDDTELQNECKHMIKVLHDKGIIPAMEFHASFAKNSSNTI